MLTSSYAKSGDLHIAYATAGEGPIDMVWVTPTVSHVEYLWTEPSLEAALEQLTSFCRVVMFDRRGSGMSDPILGAPTLEEQMDDVHAVMDAVGSEQAALVGSIEGGPMAMLFAASHPDRVSHLILYGTFARSTWAPDYDWTWKEEERQSRTEQLLEYWGKGYMVAGVAPSKGWDPAFLEWAGRLERLAASPSSVERIFTMMGEIDVRHVLPSIRVPTLVMHRRDDTFIDVRHSRYLSEKIPGARYVELDGRDNLFSLGDTDGLLGEVEEFITGARHEREPDRMLATVLFTDICDSTARAAQIGDTDWRRLLEQHDALVRRSLERHRGEEVKHTGDGFLATFDGPARAIRAAGSIADGVRSLGLEVRAGLHTGELEVRDHDLGGLAVHIGARVMDRAGPGEVLVSSTVKDLVVGSGIDFSDRGVHELKGVPGQWRLYQVA